jgi:hypothetical protein
VSSKKKKEEKKRKRKKEKKIKELGIVIHIRDSCTRETEAGRLQVQANPAGGG